MPEDATTWIVLLTALLLVAHQVWQDRRNYPAFERLEKTDARQHAFRRWLFESFIRYGVLGVVGLYLLGHLDALVVLPDNLKAARAGLDLGPGRAALIGYGLAAVMTVAMIASAFAGFRIDPAKVPRDGVGALLPRNWREARWTAGLSVNAGLTEEIFFRALLLVAIFEVSGSLILAILLGAAVFGIAHLYQGISGVFITGIIGLVFMLIYVATGALWLVILIHALMDLRGLVLLPWSIGWLSPNKEPHG